MSTLNNVELIIITVVLSVFFLLGCIVAFQTVRMMIGVNRLAKKAESFITSAQTAAESITKLSSASQGKLPLLRIINHFFDSTKKRSK